MSRALRAVALALFGATLLAVLEPGTVMLLKRRFAGLAASGTRKRS